MTYATRADMDAIYPGTLKRVAYNPETRDVDDLVVGAALAAATAEVDMFLSQRYALPLVPVAPMVKQFCVDIAMYRICLTRDKLTNEMRVRYEDTVARLTMLAAGKIGLGNPTIDPASGKPSSGAQDANNGRAQIVLMRRQG